MLRQASPLETATCSRFTKTRARGTSSIWGDDNIITPRNKTGENVEHLTITALTLAGHESRSRIGIGHGGVGRGLGYSSTLGDRFLRYSLVEPQKLALVL